MAVSISIQIDQNSQNVLANTSNVTVKTIATWTGGSFNYTYKCTGSMTIDGTTYNYTGLAFNKSQTTSGSEVIMTKTLDISHSSDGTKTLSCSAVFDSQVSSGKVSASNSRVLTRIARASTFLSVGSGSLGSTQSISINTNSSSFRHTILYSCGSVSGTAMTLAAGVTSGSWIPPTSLGAQAPTAGSVSVTLSLYTYDSNGNQVGDPAYETVSLSIPYGSGPSVSIAIEDLDGHGSAYGGYVSGQSRMKITVSATGDYGATVSDSTINIRVNGSYYYSSSVTIVVPRSSSLKIDAYATDSRGNTGSASKNVSLVYYDAASINTISAVRRSSDQGMADVSVSVSSYPLNNKNLLRVTVKYENNSDSADAGTIGSSNGYGTVNISGSFSADTGNSYTITVEAHDDFSSPTRTQILNTAEVIMNFHKSGRGIGIGKVSEYAGRVEFGWPAYGTFQSSFLMNGFYDQDLNNITIPGMYFGYCDIDADDMSIPSMHLPTCSQGKLQTGYATLEVFGVSDSTYLIQRVTAYNGIIFTRYYNGSTWSSWVGLGLS